MNKLHKFCQNPFAGTILARKIRPRYPHERTFVQPAKLVDARRMGPFTLGHYQSNPPERPDHVTTSVCRFRSAAADDYECLSWRVDPATPEDLARWPARDPGGVSEHMLALSTPSGEIVLFDFFERAEAKRLMDTIAAVTPEPAKASAHVTTYPITREEVRILAAHWTDIYREFAGWCVRHESDGTAEKEAEDYATSRVLLAQSVLGMDEVQAVGREVDGRYRDQPQPDTNGWPSQPCAIIPADFGPDGDVDDHDF